MNVTVTSFITSNILESIDISYLQKWAAIKFSGFQFAHDYKLFLNVNDCPQKIY